MRESSFKARKATLSKSPDLYVSATRLSIRNLPLSVTEKELKSACVSAISKFKQQVQKEERQHLTQEERSEGWDKKPKLMQVKIMRDKDRVDKDGNMRSKGFGFVEWQHHAHALAMLRWMNANDEAFGIKDRRPIVEFSIENLKMVKRRSERTQKAKVFVEAFNYLKVSIKSK